MPFRGYTRYIFDGPRTNGIGKRFMTGRLLMFLASDFVARPPLR